MLKFISALSACFDMKLRNRYHFILRLHFEAIVPSLAYISFCQLAVFRNVRFRNELSCVFLSKISFFFLLLYAVLGKKFTIGENEADARRISAHLYFKNVKLIPYMSEIIFFYLRRDEAKREGHFKYLLAVFF